METSELAKIDKNKITFNDVQEKIITIRNKNVILDSDVAMLYGVETMHLNQAVKRNLDKFPEGYVINLTESEKEEVITICDNPKVKFSPVLPNAFTEKGLYMLATILKSETATNTTIAIVETFAKLRELTLTAADMIKTPDDSEKQVSFMQKTNELLTEVITKELKTTATETTFEFNLMSAVKIKHTIKKEIK
jgi:phage regulator Rha-like protein